MELSGRYELVIDYKLPDGEFIPVNNLINFFLNDNPEAEFDLESNLHDDYIFFDKSKYGILNQEDFIISNCIRSLGYINKDYKIVKPEELLVLLKKLSKDAFDLHKNKKSWEREVKIKMVENG